MLSSDQIQMINWVLPKVHLVLSLVLKKLVEQKYMIATVYLNWVPNFVRVSIEKLPSFR